MKRSKHLLTTLAGLFLCVPLSTAQKEAVTQDPVIVVDGVPYATWPEYVRSPQFAIQGLRCAIPKREQRLPRGEFRSIADCSLTNTNPAAQYAPGVIYDIPVVVHVIQSTNGQGAISDALVRSQIDILNEDFRALPGTNGAPGTDTRIRFHLATVDPSGNPTSGITRSTNNTWFNDGGSYWNALAWDTNRYLNIYTNRASGALGYVPDLPQGNIVGQNADRVVVLWSSFGRNGPIGPPFNQGRTTTHEVGHYLGLEHTFTGGCSGGNCYRSGDLICDTNPEAFPANGCPSSNTCGSPDPVDNYMDYSDDLCMSRFTEEQTRRMRCTLENYRPGLALPQNVTAAATVRNGGGNNPVSFVSLNRPLIGANWDTTIAGPSGTYTSAVIVSLGGPTSGPNLAIGQLLIQPPFLPYFLGNGSHSLALPNDASLLGRVFATQGATLQGGAVQLTNAIDLTLGNQ